MDKKTTVISIVGTVLLAAMLLGIGTLIGRSLFEPKTIILNTNGEQNLPINFAQTENTITVVGQSKLNIKPDIALLNLGVEICDPDASRANQQVNEKLASLITGLLETGLDKNDVVPTGFSLYPRYNYTGDLQLLAGFCASNRVEVTTTKLDQVSNIIDKAIFSGATNVYGVNFTVKDMESASQEGIQLAFQDAERQAKTLAKLMGASVQGVVSSNIEMSGYLVDTFIGYSGGGGSVTPQEATVTVKITIVYAVGK